MEKTAFASHLRVDLKQDPSQFALEAELRRTQLRLRQAERFGQIGTWVLEVQTGALAWSDETYQIFGRRADDFVLTRDSFYEAVHPLDRGLVRKAMAEALAQKTPYQCEYRVTRPDGSHRWIRAQAEFAPDPSLDPALLGTVQDITAWRELEDQFRRAQKMEVLGRLAGGVAHDFNNLLTVVRGRAEMILADERLSPLGTESLLQIVKAADRATDLTRQIVNFSRRPPAQLQPLDWNVIVTSLTKLLRHIIGEDIQIHVDLAPGLPSVQADQALLEQILMNLAVHARTEMPHGGEFLLKTDMVDRLAYGGADGTAGGDAGRPGRFVRLLARTSPNAKSRAREARLGAGVQGPEHNPEFGLAAVRAIVKDLTGWITPGKEIDSATILTIFLPALLETKAGAPGGAAIPALRGGSERILLVEDDQGLRRFVCLLLQRLGYQVDEAATGLEGLTCWQRNKGNYDLLLTDVVMPAGLGGWDLLAQIRQENAGIRAVVVSGYSQEGIEERLAADRFTRALMKPFTPEALAQAVRSCLDTA